MKRISAILVTMLFFGVLAANAQDRVLVDGNPQLTQNMVNNLVRFFEWSLDGKLTKLQRNTLTNLTIAQFQNPAKPGVKQTMNLMSIPGRVAQLSLPEQKALHDQAQAEMLRQMKNMPNNKLKKLLYDVYNRHGAPDPLDRKSGD